MEIRKAQIKDIPQILNLLKQVNLIHHNGRPDILNAATKYTKQQLADIINDSMRPVLVAENDGKVKGYAFCVYQTNDGDNMLTDIKTLYVDDLCVDENCRGKGVGKTLYNAVLQLAKQSGCYNVTLNVWCLNDGAMQFYKKCGLKPLKIYMEKIID